MITVHLESKRVEVRKARRPQRPEGFAVIRLLRGGICNTDLELQRGYYGFSGTPGHEFIGEVVEWLGKSTWRAANATGAGGGLEGIAQSDRYSELFDILGRSGSS